MKMKGKTKSLSESEIALRRKRKRVFKDNLTLFLMAFPGLACVLIFKYLPMPNLVLAFKDYVPRLGVWASEWIGFENFKFIFQTNDLQIIIRNTVGYGVFFLVWDIVVGILLALMLYHLTSRKASNVYKMIMQFPRFLSVVVVSYLVYAFLSPSYGVINQLVTSFGGDAIQWYKEASYWPVVLTIVRTWMVMGGGCLLYYATLLGIDNSLFEAASMDGANTLQKCWHIAVPALKPVICLNVTFGMGSIFGGDLGLFYNIPLSHGELFPTTQIIDTYVYRSLLGGEISRPTAVGLMQALVALVLVLIVNAIMRKVSPDNALF